MIGLALGGLLAVIRAGKDAISKTAVTEADAYTTGWALRALTVPFLVVVVLIVTNGQPAIPSERGFWLALATNATLFTALTVCLMKAYEHAEVSLVAPIMATSPAVMLLPAWVLLGEFPTPLSVVGIGLVCTGVYLLNASTLSRGVTEPIRALIEEEGFRYAAAALCITAVISPIDKFGVQHSSPTMWALALHSALAITLLPVMWTRSEGARATLAANWRPLVALGAVNGTLWVVQTYAYAHALVTNVVALKNFSAVLTVVIGHIWFDDANIRDRLVGASVATLGTVLILLGA